MQRCLNAYLAASPTERCELAERVRQATEPARNNLQLVEHYRSLLRTGGRESRTPVPANGATRSPPVPLVSVVVTHYNLPDYLPKALASLAAQTYPSLEVLVIDDGSSCPLAQQVWQEQQQAHPQYRFLTQENAGCGVARNRGLAEARGEYVLFLDADNVALPQLISTLVCGLQRNPEVAVMSCYLLAFNDTEAGQRQCLFVNAFAGGPHLMACFENIYGDTTALFRTAALREIGGFDTACSNPCEDWYTYVKLVHAGYRVEVVPEVLFHYRVARTAAPRSFFADRRRKTRSRSGCCASCFPDQPCRRAWSRRACLPCW